MCWRHFEPTLKEHVVGEQRLQLRVDGRNVGRVSGQCGPPERPHPSAEERPDIGRDEARVCEGVTQASSKGLTSQVVAIIENVAPHPDELDHGADVRDDRFGRESEVLGGIALTERRRLLERHFRRDVAGERVVRRRLIRHEVECLAARDQLREHVCRVRPEGDRQRPALVRRAADAGERVVERIRLLLDVAHLEAPVDRTLIHLHTEDRRPGHRRRERLRAAHPPEAGREHGAPGEIGGAEVRFPRRAEGLVRPLKDSLGPDVDPRPGGHLPEHRQTLGLESAELVPGRPRGHEQRVGDQDPRSARVRAEHADRLPRLHEERLVVAKTQKGANDLAERVVRAGRTPRAPVDDE